MDSLVRAGKVEKGHTNMPNRRWRIALDADDDPIAEMCRCLYVEDPGPSPIPPKNIEITLATLRRDPGRGRAVVLDIDGRVSGYALLIAFWSNELGGTVCEVDELFIIPQHRNQGHGSALFAAISEDGLWPGALVAIALGTTPHNAAARRLYKRLGFAELGIAMIRRVQRSEDSTAEPEGFDNGLHSAGSTPSSSTTVF